MTALAGEFDESKHSRAENGEFGSGGGGGGGGEHTAPEKSDHSPQGKLDIAVKRHEEAKAAHADARNTPEREDLHAEVQRFRAQHSKDVTRAGALLDETKKEIPHRKAELKQLKKKEADVLQAKGVSEAERDDVLSHDSAKFLHSSFSRQVAEHDTAVAEKPPRDEHEQRVRDNKRKFIAEQANYYGDEERARRPAAEAASAKLGPDGHELVRHVAKKDSELEDAVYTKDSLNSALKAAPKHAQLHDQLETAVANNDMKAAKSITRKISNHEGSETNLRSVLSNRDSSDTQADPANVADAADRLIEAHPRNQKAIDRAARAEAAHAKIVERRKRGL